MCSLFLFKDAASFSRRLKPSSACKRPLAMLVLFFSLGTRRLLNPRPFPASSPRWGWENQTWSARRGFSGQLLPRRSCFRSINGRSIFSERNSIDWTLKADLTFYLVDNSSSPQLLTGKCALCLRWVEWEDKLPKNLPQTKVTRDETKTQPITFKTELR